MASQNSHSQLCFLEHSRLNAPLVDPLDVWTEEGTRIGRFDGVVIDPREQRACFLVVDRGRFRPDRCLVPLPARLDLAHQALCVDADDGDVQPFRPSEFSAFRESAETFRQDGARP